MQRVVGSRPSGELLCGGGRGAAPSPAAARAARRWQRAGCRASRPGALVVRVQAGDGAAPNKVNARGMVLRADVPELPFKKLMACNRGEIAIRIIRAGLELGLDTLAIYSKADRLAPHRFKADESYEVGSANATPVQCYLDIKSILAVAKAQGVDVIHPGYGFLSENAAFAAACRDAGIAFVGPSPETIEALGDKARARAAAVAAGVPVTPGTDGPVAGVAEAKAFAARVGYPVMVKAVCGGGGRGMRIVREEAEMEPLFALASSEAAAAFGDGAMIVERLVTDARHIEVQILADQHGGVVHLHERDCSVQRRHQKVVEIAPAPGLPEPVRAAVLEDAVRIARALAYRNAGTVEFLVAADGSHFFMEVNPRIQVEHTVTEEITGIDLVQAQVRIAGGATLAQLGLGSQADVPPPSGFALQCRITSEDPEANFRPDTGRITAYRSPGGPGVRLDGSLGSGHTVSRHYDSLLVKVITKAPTYLTAIQKMQRALYEFHIRGVKTNIPFLENVLRAPEFLAGGATTSFIERNAAELFRPGGGHGAAQAAKLLLYLADQIVNGARHPGATGAPPARRAAPPPPALPSGFDPTVAPPPGWADVLRAEGPAGWAAAVRRHRRAKGVLLTDTTWRDAHQSLLATRLRTHDMLAAAPATARVLAPAASLECWGGATFDVSLRFLRECPWARLEALREAVPNIPLQMLLRVANAVGYTTYCDATVYAFVAEAKAAGVDLFRIFDSLNDADQLRFGLDTVFAAGGVAEAAICYTGDVCTSPKYTLDYYLTLADAMVAHGAHALAIKDMAGLLKPRAATLLVGALRARFPDTPIAVHTHDTAGTGVATLLAAAAAGADILDCAVDSMSGTTSQPSMGALVHSLAGTELDTGVDPAGLLALVDFWEAAREQYSPFESTLRSANSDVYVHEMPGGQAGTLGLGNQWPKVKAAYAAANRALGDIVKVTPSSKVVGDLALFLVANDIADEHELLEKASTLSFPNSVVEFLQGAIGYPAGGFPEPLRSRVIKDLPRVEGRPGASLPPVSLADLGATLRARHAADGGGAPVSYRDVLSAAMYPEVFEGYRDYIGRYSPFLDRLPTRAFFAPLGVDEEIDVELSRGNTVTIKYKACGDLQPSGSREVFFEVNGVPRVVEVREEAAKKTAGGGGGGGASGAAAAGARAARDRADPANVGSVGAPMAGEVVDVVAAPGLAVRAGQALCTLSAMKMETQVAAPCAGTVQHVYVVKGDAVDAGECIVLIRPEEEQPAAPAPA